MHSFAVTALNSSRVFRAQNLKGDKEQFILDFSPWAEDNETITSVSWSIKAGSATISGENLIDDIASAYIALDDTDGALIEVTATTANLVKTAYIDVMVHKVEKESTDYV